MNFGKFRRAGAGLVLGLALAGGAAAAGPASAATGVPAISAVQHAPLIGEYKLCDKSDHTECATSEGVNAQMLTFTAGYSTFNPVESGAEIIWKNQTGNCVHGTDTGIVTVVSSCTFSNTASVWTEVSVNGTIGFKNVAYGGLIYATGDGNGQKLELAAQGTPGLFLITDLDT